MTYASASQPRHGRDGPIRRRLAAALSRPPAINILSPTTAVYCVPRAPNDEPSHGAKRKGERGRGETREVSSEKGGSQWEPKKYIKVEQTKRRRRRRKKDVCAKNGGGRMSAQIINETTGKPGVDAIARGCDWLTSAHATIFCSDLFRRRDTTARTVRLNGLS